MLVDCQAIVLAGQKLGEADTLVTLLTLERGLINGVAKSARRMKSRFGSAVQPFTYGHAILLWRRGEGLRSLTHFDPIHSFQRLRESYDGLNDAAAMVNAARRLLSEDQPSADAFRALLNALRSLEAGQTGDRAVFWYLLALLQAAGYQPRVDRCLLGRHAQGMVGTGTRWLFVPHLGGTVCAACVVGADGGPGQDPTTIPLTAGTHAFLRQAVRMPPAFRQRLSAGRTVFQEARGVLDACVAERGRRLIKRPVPPRVVPPAVNAGSGHHV